MNRIEILVCTELFNIRKRKDYPKQVIKDVYKEINSLFGFPFVPFDTAGSYFEFKQNLKERYLSRSQIEYKYVSDLLNYLDNFASVQIRCNEW